MEVDALITRTKDAVINNRPFTEDELNSAVQSLQNLAGSSNLASIDWGKLKFKFAECAHLSHKDWACTTRYAGEIRDILKDPADDVFREIFRRVLGDGNWYGACGCAVTREADAAIRQEEEEGAMARQKRAEEAKQTDKPWAVLVTGLNGIRKTSAMYEPWFQTALSQALGGEGFAPGSLPTGANSFFRQLDFLVATMANHAFHALYDDEVIKSEELQVYARYKDVLFARYDLTAV